MNAWLLIAGTVVVLIAAGYGLLKFKSSSDWGSVDGVVIASAIEMITRSSQIRTGGDRAVDYKLNISYRYEVSGNEFTGDKVVVGIPNIVGNKIDAEDMLSRYPAGKTVKVFYNPANPSDAALITSQGVPIAGLVLVGALIILISGLIILAIRFLGSD